MKKVYECFFSVIFFFAIPDFYTQTVNIGDLIVNSGTVFSSIGLFSNPNTGNFINDGELYLYNDLTNDGMFTFTDNLKSAKVKFIGGNTQDVNGTYPIELYKVELNSLLSPPDVAIRLYNDINVFGEAIFIRGILDNRHYGGKFVFEKNSKAVNTSNESFIIGEVVSKGSTSFTFPIGDKEFFRHNSLVLTNDSSNSFTSEYFLDNSDEFYPHENKSKSIEIINDKEFWKINRDLKSQFYLTLSWNETTTPNLLYQAPYDKLHIVRWNESSKMWVDEGGIVDVAKKEITTLLAQNETGVFTIAKVVDDVLPCSNLIFYNALSPNGDGLNDYFKVDGLSDCIGKNSLEIYNRWGAKVYETDNYDTKDNVFKGYSMSKLTLNNDDLLPTGTYFYIFTLSPIGTKDSVVKKSGYIYLSR